VVLECTDFTKTFKFTLHNDVQCRSTACSDDDMLQIFDAMEQNPALGQCNVTVFPKDSFDASRISSSQSEPNLEAKTLSLVYVVASLSGFVTVF
jgi:hypothetical protein